MKSKIENMAKDRETRRKNGFVSFILLLVGAPALFVMFAFVDANAQGRGNSAHQALILEVKPITKISVAGSPAPLVINNDRNGLDILSVSDASTKYSLVTNMDNMKIVASINNQMPAGTKLMIQLGSKAASAGSVDLSDATTPVDVVTGIRKGSDADQSICYTFIAGTEGDQVPPQSRMITLTLTN